MIKWIGKIIKFVVTTVILGILMVGLGIGYAFYIEPNWIWTKEVDLKAVQIHQDQQETIKIAQFSDTHLSEDFTIEELEKLVTIINQEQPDIIVFTGDLIDVASTYKDKEQIGKVLAKLEAPLGKYAVWGNHDYGGGGSRYYADIMEEANFMLLTNENHLVKTAKGNKICITGLDDFMLGEPYVKKTLTGCNEADYHIALLHEGDRTNRLVGYEIDLVLAGHSHGGQVYIPFKGPLVTTALGEEYIKGIYEIDQQTGMKLYVNPGIGTTKVPVRFANPPEVTVFNIEF